MRNRLGVSYAQDSSHDGVPRGGTVDDRCRAARSVRKHCRSRSTQAGIPAVGPGCATRDGEAAGEFHAAEVGLRQAEDDLPQPERHEAELPEELPAEGCDAEAADEGEFHSTEEVYQFQPAAEGERKS